MLPGLYYLVMYDAERDRWYIVGDGFRNHDQAEAAYGANVKTYGTSCVQIVYSLPTSVVVEAGIPDFRSSTTEMRISDLKV